MRISVNEGAGVAGLTGSGAASRVAIGEASTAGITGDAAGFGTSRGALACSSFSTGSGADGFGGGRG